jgi:hypothetical protein
LNKEAEEENMYGEEYNSEDIGRTRGRGKI